ncbi:MAG: (Fe-S)-binding protein [Dehalococcoidales bacterium]|nr:MAG: (Fe-S)-binding protein [Dehalococcoidales bacterium]
MDNKELIPPGLVYLADNITSKGNLLGAARGAGARWAKDLKLPQQAETILFAGCGYQFSSELESLMSLIRRIDKSAVSTEMAMSLAGFQKRLGIDAAGMYRRLMARDKDDGAQPLRDAVKVLANMGIEVGYMADEEPCCGGLLHYIGLHNDFNRHARETHDRLVAAGVKRIISLVPSCTYTLRNLIPASTGAQGIEIRHFCEIVAENVSSVELKWRGEVKVAYHDPCQLVRYLGLVEEPRSILRAIKGMELVENELTSGWWATCCGGGGGFEAVFPELSQILAVNRARELLDTGAEIIVTHCPGCIMQLETGLKEIKASGVKVFDLAQVVAMAMEE